MTEFINMVEGYLKNNHPWLWKNGIEKIEPLDDKRAVIIFGDGRSFMYDVNQPGRNKLLELEEDNEDPGAYFMSIREKAFGYSLRHLMDERGVTIKRLARKLNVSERTISRFINGSATPSIWQAVEIAKILDCELDELLETSIDFM